MQLSRMFSCGVVLAATLMLAACGGDKDKDKDKKKGDSKKNSEKLVGKWSLDSEATVKKMEAEAKTDEEKAELEFAIGMMGEMKMQFEFTADGKMNATMSGPGEEDRKEGTYTVKTEDPLVISGTIDAETKEVPITFIDDDTIEFQMSEEEGPGAMVLKRVK